MDKIIFKNGEAPYLSDNTLMEMQTNIETAIDERTPTIELLTVSSAAPSTCAVGDKYYNTTTSKIYTAIATNTWGTEGENPTSLYLYVDLEHKELYYFNGTTFISYGGGSGGAGGDTLPIGTIVPYGSDVIPDGWLRCDGSIVEQSDYPELFSVIGTTYGEGDGSTTFALPDYRGKVPVGKDSDDTDFDELGKTGGRKDNNLQVVAEGYGLQVDSLSYSNRIVVGKSGITQEQSDKDNLQPYLVTNFIIKAKMTVAIEGEIIQEDGTASMDNVYSAVAVDNKIKTNIVTGQEVATNEYIDGKQVFVKRVEFTLPTTLNAWTTLIQLDSTVDDLIDKKLRYYNNEANYDIPYNFENEEIICYFNKNDKTLKVKANFSYPGGKPGWGILKYTKN